MVDSRIKNIACLIVFLGALFINNVNAQFKIDKNYPFTYKVKLPDYPSYCYFQIDNSKIKSKDKQTFLLSVKCIDENSEPLSFIAIKLFFSNNDTLLLTTDIDGLIGKEINTIGKESFILMASIVGYSNLKLSIPMHENERAKNITLVLGHSFSTDRIIIYSRRELTHEEMQELIKDISVNNKESRLLKDETCYWMVEI